MDQTARIQKMEDRMDRVREWVDSLSCDLDELPSVQADIDELSSYYESGQWLADYEADEAGQLPPDLKRGVLSQDGLYDLLMEFDDLIRRLREIGGGKQ